MWVCGCCNSKFLQFPLEEIRAREGVCFVGDTYFLLHSSNLCEDSIELSGMSAKEAYGKVYIIGEEEIVLVSSPSFDSLHYLIIFILFYLFAIYFIFNNHNRSLDARQTRNGCR